MLGVVFLGLMSHTDTTPREQTAAPQEKEATPEEGAKGPGYEGPKVLTIGDSFELGDFRYRIDRVSHGSKIGQGFAQKRASAGAIYVWVVFSIRNDSNETKTVMTDDFVLVDSQGRRFRASSEANTAVVMSGERDFLLRELQPGIEKKAGTAFEIPADAFSSGLCVEVPEKGFFGSKKVTVELVK
jgi:hypothetical protein